MWHDPQQQHAGAGFLHCGIAAHVVLIPAKAPLMVAHVVGAAIEQIFVVGLQHAPETSCPHTAGSHAAPGPYHTPCLARHSHGVTWAQVWKMQQVPKSCVPAGGHGFGLHTAPATNAPALGHWACEVTAVHTPVHAAQHAPPVGGGHGGALAHVTLGV